MLGNFGYKILHAGETRRPARLSLFCFSPDLDVSLRNSSGYLNRLARKPSWMLDLAFERVVVEGS